MYFFAWNTTGDIYSAKCLFKNTIPSGGKVTTEQLDGYRVLWDQLLECYFLADFPGAPKFGNAIIDALFKAIDDERGDRNELKMVLSEMIVLQPLPVTPFVHIENDIHDEDLNNGDENEGGDDEETVRARIRLRDPFGLSRPQQRLGRCSVLYHTRSNECTRIPRKAH
ncbi:hypothetical protein DID88_000216 [Monilinia fructigena]|uniref:Uncharacterized protein n=1 Tax=Monilinia fructigena TaxID=38457 RepID=A0A395IJT9_9HELO|nr:hypothetical protein DID88_000216 [Monilinia fructigena]